MTEARAISDGVDLKALIERVREAKGSDPQLDIDMCLALGYIGYVDAPINLRRAEDGWLDYESVEDGQSVSCADVAPNLTGSMDAAAGLVDRLLKVYSLTITIDPSGNGAKLTWWPDGLSGRRQIHADEVSESPVSAILLALLTSLSEDTTHAK